MIIVKNGFKNTYKASFLSYGFNSFLIFLFHKY